MQNYRAPKITLWYKHPLYQDSTVYPLSLIMAKKKNVTKVESNAKQVEASKHVDAKAKQATKQVAKQIAKQAAKQVPKPTPKQEVGLLVTKELQKAIDDCREKVERIAKECRASNRKFRCVFSKVVISDSNERPSEISSLTWRTTNTDAYTDY